MSQPPVPPERVEEKVEDWREKYSVEHLAELTKEDVTSAQLEFMNEVRTLKTEYNRGRLVSAEMAEVLGREPYTHDQLRDIRRYIQDEADKISMNFKRAKGRIERERANRRSNTIVKGAERIADSLTNISISINVPWSK
jgi:hypothetical protein